MFKRALSSAEVLGLYNARASGKCRPSGSVPAPAGICVNSNAITVTAVVCNNGADTRTYSLNFATLDANSAANLGVSGALTWPNISGSYFTIQGQNPLTVSPHSCKNVFVTIKKPSNLGFGLGNQLAAYQMLITDSSTMDTFSSIGELAPNYNCVGPTTNHNTGGTFTKGTDVTNLVFNLANAANAPAVFNAQLTVFNATLQPDTNYVSLNGLAVGTPVPFTIPLPANGSTNINVSVSFVDNQLLQPFYVVLSVDDGAGGPLMPTDSAVFMNVMPPTVGPVLFIDATNNQQIISWDLINTGWTLDSNTNLNGGNWIPVPSAIGPLPDGSQGLILQPTNTAQYFRLRQ